MMMIYSKRSPSFYYIFDVSSLQMMPARTTWSEPMNYRTDVNILVRTAIVCILVQVLYCIAAVWCIQRMNDTKERTCFSVKKSYFY